MIEEPTQFLCDVSQCGADSLSETWFTCDDGECDGDPLEGFDLAADPDPANDDDEVSDETIWKYWIVKVGSFGNT